MMESRESKKGKFDGDFNGTLIGGSVMTIHGIFNDQVMRFMHKI